MINFRVECIHRLYHSFWLTHNTYHPGRRCRLASGDSRNLFHLFLYLSLLVEAQDSRVSRFIVFFFFFFFFWSVRDILRVNWYSFHIWAWFILVLFCLYVFGLQIRKWPLLLYYSFLCSVIYNLYKQTENVDGLSGPATYTISF